MSLPGDVGRLRVGTDVPDGWRMDYVNREFLPEAAFERGIQILGVRTIEANRVCIIRRIEAGVFGSLDGVQVAQFLGQHHWWAPHSDQHPLFVGGPDPEIDWNLHVIRSNQVPDVDNQAPPKGTIIPIPPTTNPSILGGDVTHLWDWTRLAEISYSAHLIVVGPCQLGFFASWRQPPAAEKIGWQLCQSWGIMEGVEMRYDDAEFRRILLAGFP